MTHKDTTFDSVYWLEQKQIRNKKGCSKCAHKTKKYWGKWLCKHNNRVNKSGYCKYWRFDEGVK